MSNLESVLQFLKTVGLASLETCGLSRSAL